VSLLSAAGISKAYNGARALEGVDLDVEAGEVHALLGENGAGKSTLIKILSGAVTPDRGDVSVDGVRLPPGDPLAARRLGISIVYQEFTLAPELSVADNVFLGRERGRFLLQRREMRARVATLLEQLGVRVPASAPVGSLSVAHQQLVEIARALVNDARVLILDEPSAALSGPEVGRLMTVLRELRAKGLGIVYISHRLEEIIALADRVTVLRDGRRIVTVPMGACDRPQLIRWMVGRDVSEEFPPRDPRPGRTVLEVAGLQAPPRFTDASFCVRQGEIVGLAGLVGAGRTSAALAIVGALEATGELRIDGRLARFRSPADAIGAGLAYVTEDRKTRGIFPVMATRENITIAYLSSFARNAWLSLTRERAAAEGAAARFAVRAASLSQPAVTLSGGNQQKALLARFLLEPRRLLILDEPTRGVDVGSRSEIYRLMNRLTDEGLAILMISSDLPEILGMADRIVVMHTGRTAGELPRERATAEAVMALATAPA
jgi:ABC-type sugar transport system ATPase subunit